MSSNYRPQILMLRPQDLKVDPRVQRTLAEARVNKLIAEWDDEKLGVIDVSRRANGEDYVTDGWHRVQALVRMGKGADEIPAQVTHSFTLAQEAKRFVAKNGEVRRPHPIDLFRINHVAGNEESVEVTRIVEAHGLRIRNDNNQGSVSCVSALVSLYRTGGEELLDEVLQVIEDAWGNEAGSHPVGLVKALGYLLGNEDLDIDRSVLARKLAEDGTPARLVGKGKTLASTMSKSVNVATAEVIVAIYNKNKSTNRVRLVN